MKKVKVILNRILTVILIATLIFSGYVLFTVVRTEKGRVPCIFGYSFMKVASGSMEPTIPTGRVVVVRQTDASQIMVGDIISFYSTDPSIAGKPNTHRVVSIGEENGRLSFTTRGDAVGVDDPYTVSPDQLIGVYKRSLSIGKLVDVIHSQYFFFFALLIPLCLVMFYELMHFRKIAEEREKKKHEKDADS